MWSSVKRATMQCPPSKERAGDVAMVFTDISLIGTMDWGRPHASNWSLVAYRETTHPLAGHGGRNGSEGCKDVPCLPSETHSRRNPFLVPVVS